MMGLLSLAFSTVIGRAITAAVGVLFAVWAYGSYRESKGASGAISEMKEATNHATSQGRRAADQSRSGGVRGKIDPGYRN